MIDSISAPKFLFSAPAILKKFYYYFTPKQNIHFITISFPPLFLLLSLLFSSRLPLLLPTTSSPLSFSIASSLSPYPLPLFLLVPLISLLSNRHHHLLSPFSLSCFPLPLLLFLLSPHQGVRLGAGRQQFSSLEFRFQKACLVWPCGMHYFHYYNCILIVVVNARRTRNSPFECIWSFCICW